MWLKAWKWIGLNKTLALIIAGAIAFGGYSTVIYFKGGKAEQLKQANEQIKQDEKTRKSHAKIDRATPFSADKHDAGVWLLNYTRGQ